MVLSGEYIAAIYPHEIFLRDCITIINMQNNGFTWVSDVEFLALTTDFHSLPNEEESRGHSNKNYAPEFG